MDKYEKSLFNGSNKIKIKKMKKENRFITKNIVCGESCIIKLEREENKTLFYIKNKDKFEKHEIFMLWEKDDVKLSYDGFWYITDNKEELYGGEGDREYQEKQCVGRILDIIKKNKGGTE